MLRNRRVVVSTALLAAAVFLTAALVFFLGSSAQAAGRVGRPAHAAKGTDPNPLAELLASDAWPGDEFGWSVSVSGSTAVVGAPYSGGYTGAAYVFSKAGGTWTQAAELTASDASTAEDFGWSVSVSGSTVVVGAPGYYYNQGAAYVFTDTAGTWTQTAEVTAPDASGGDKFGNSVLASGSTFFVGADDHGGDTGAVYVFSDQGGTSTEQQELLAADGASSDQFGWSMAISGATVLVSAVRHDETGAVYVFVDQGGTWTEQQELTSSDGADDDYFGDKVAISGSRLVVGAPGHDDEHGAAYVFTDSGGTWKQQAEVTASDGAPHNCFGWAVGMSGKTVLVAAEEHASDAGAVYVFKKAKSGWAQKMELSPPDAAAGNEFGYSASLSGTTALVGADQAEAGAGSAYIYRI